MINGKNRGDLSGVPQGEAGVGIKRNIDIEVKEV